MDIENEVEKFLQSKDIADDLLEFIEKHLDKANVLCLFWRDQDNILHSRTNYEEPSLVYDLEKLKLLIISGEMRDE